MLNYGDIFFKIKQLLKIIKKFTCDKNVFQWLFLIFFSKTKNLQ